MRFVAPCALHLLRTTIRTRLMAVSKPLYVTVHVQRMTTAESMACVSRVSFKDSVVTANGTHFRVLH